MGLRAPLYGEAVYSLLSEEEQAQFKRNLGRLSQLNQFARSRFMPPEPTDQPIFLFRKPLRLVGTHFKGPVEASDIFFLDRVEGKGALFSREVNGSDTHYSQNLDLVGATFEQEVQFRNTLFFDQAQFSQAQFQASANFRGGEFQETADFSQTVFQKDAHFNRVEWRGNANFTQTTWRGSASFVDDTFLQSLLFKDARFENSLLLRQAQFSQPVNLQGASLLGQADFGDTQFIPGAYIDVSGFEFNADQAEILGSPGQIGQYFSASPLPGNETLLRNLVRNFRRLEQIPDANQIEYTTERLRLRELRKRLLGININTASRLKLTQIGFSPIQARAIAATRIQHPFLSAVDLLNLESVDLGTYTKVRDRIVTEAPLTWVKRFQVGSAWSRLELLLLLSHYGTNFGLAFGVGIVAIALFGLMFWGVDRYRRRTPTAIVSPLGEAVWMLSSFTVLILVGIGVVVHTADRPWLTLTCLGLVTIPTPMGLLIWLYRQGRYHDLMEISYFVEDGSMRQLRFLIARLPIIPKFPFFRDRYTPILLDRRWNWLNYYDFSLNNWLKFGFNDIRLRDQHLPGIVAALAWYQWSLGVLYITLLLWTLSRTIPGLNLLLYF
ncbi:MAG: hypothetical protein QNJ46_18695 [Leptolyngbyaceae cyanobacterium MO_188.B28]|nr:hypothetical protein [Leptolyngbyaceae cyanobacterium MO_188.B28]